MLTLAIIRKDLKNIKYYYMRKDLIDKACANMGEVEICSIVKKYNSAMKSADPKFIDLYYSLYLQNNTQESYSNQLGCTPEYVQMLNKQLLKFLQKQLETKEESCNG